MRMVPFVVLLVGCQEGGWYQRVETFSGELSVSGADLRIQHVMSLPSPFRRALGRHPDEFGVRPAFGSRGFDVDAWAYGEIDDGLLWVEEGWSTADGVPIESLGPGLDEDISVVLDGACPSWRHAACVVVHSRVLRPSAAGAFEFRASVALTGFGPEPSARLAVEGPFVTEVE